MTRRIRPVTQRGFTIIELLIATAIFAVITIAITTAILQFTRQYYRGVIASNTQTTARTIIDDISRSIQFNGGELYELNTPTGTKGFCVGSSKRYSYALNTQVTRGGGSAALHQGHHALVSDTYPSCNTATPALGVASLANLTSPNARELLGQRMRVTKFEIRPSGGMYVVTVRVVYGDDDLLTSTTDPNMSCKSTAGSQFCAVSELSTTVKKRVN